MARLSLRDLGRSDVALTIEEALTIISLSAVSSDPEFDDLCELKQRLGLTDEQYERARGAAS